MTTERDKIIAAAREAGFGALTPYGEECTEKFYTIAFEAGAASRDAEVAELVAVLEVCHRYGKEALPGGYITNITGTVIGHPDNIAIIDAALAKVRKPE